MSDNIQIKHRLAGTVLFEGKFASLKLCVEAAINAGADLRDADLRGADLRDADLRDADLRGADLRDADLRGAYLGGAHLRGTDLGENRIYTCGGRDWRGYHFYCITDIESVTIRAGCRTWHSFSEARDHYGENYKSDGNRAECLARIGLMASVIKALRASDER